MKATFTKFKLEETRQYATEIINNMDKGMDIRDILANVYVSGFANKSMMQGYIMADGILETIKSFDAEYNFAKKNLGDYIDRVLDKAAQGKSLEAKCELWLTMKENISKALSIINNDDNVEKNVVETSISTEVTEEYEAQLYNELKQTMSSSGVLLSNIFENMSEYGVADNADVIVDMGIKEYDVRAVMSMLTYINFKNNQIENIPTDTNIEQITTLVCIETETVRIYDQVGRSLTKEIAAFLLNVLGAIVIGVSLFMSIIAGAALIISLFGECFLSLLLAWWFIAEAVIVMDDAFCMAYADWEKMTDKIIDFVSVSIKNIRKGVVKIKRYLTEDDILLNTESETVEKKKFVTV